MTIEQLEFFYAISVNRTFSQAAFEMNITQSALSKQIAKLEQELGVDLFNRTHRQVCLTAEGEKILKDVEILLKDYHQMLKHVNEIKTQSKNTIKIAMLPIFFQYNLADKLQTFNQKFPHISLEITEIEERDLNQLSMTDYDVYILRGKASELASFSSFLLYRDCLVALVSNQHPFAKKSKLSFSDLKNQPLLLPPKYTSMTEIVVNESKQVGFEPNVFYHGRLETIITRANQNQGIALMMSQSLHLFQLQGLKVIPFEKEIQGNIYVYYQTQSICKEAILKLVNDLQSK